MRLSGRPSFPKAEKLQMIRHRPKKLLEEKAGFLAITPITKSFELFLLLGH